MDRSDPLERATRPRQRGETWTDEQFVAAREADLSERTAAISSAVIAALSCLLLAALLTSGKIVEIAQRQEFGEARDRQLAVAEGLDRVANFLSLNRPYDTIRSIRGAGEDVGERVDTIEEVAVSTSTTVTPTTSSEAPNDGTTSTTTTTIVAVPLRTVGVERPLTVLVAGDSQAEYLGQAVTTEHPGWALEVDIDDRISTSLARPDYFNWPAHLASVAADATPEAVVLFIGANDHQDMVDSTGERLVEGTLPWQAEWTHRLELTLDLFAGGDTRVFWVTQPPMRDGDLDEGMELINSLAQPVVAAREFVTAVDIWELFGGTDGYQDRVTRDGESIDARVSDGVHLTRSAASWVADLVFEEMSEEWDFEP